MALSWHKGLQNPAGRLARWALSVQRYKYTIEYKRGVVNHVADALSRPPLLGQKMQVDPDLVALAKAAPITPDSRWGTLVSREKLRAAQLSDGLCQKVMPQLAEENAADAGNARDLDSYLLSSDGILLRYIPQADDGSSGPPFRTVIPRKLCIKMTDERQQANINREFRPVKGFEGIQGRYLRFPHDVLDKAECDHCQYIPKQRTPRSKPDRPRRIRQVADASANTNKKKTLPAPSDHPGGATNTARPEALQLWTGGR
ncbi:uncharacterized protein ISCGN_020097 [Ixodes scapularis]